MRRLMGSTTWSTSWRVFYFEKIENFVDLPPLRSAGLDSLWWRETQIWSHFVRPQWEMPCVAWQSYKQCLQNTLDFRTLTLSTFFIQPFQQNTNSCLLMLPSPETLKIMKRSLISWVSILITQELKKIKQFLKHTCKVSPSRFWRALCRLL